VRSVVFPCVFRFGTRIHVYLYVSVSVCAGQMLGLSQLRKRFRKEHDLGERGPIPDDLKDAWDALDDTGKVRPRGGLRSTLHPHPA